MNSELYHIFFRLIAIFKATNPFLNNAVIFLKKTNPDKRTENGFDFLQADRNQN